MASEFLVRLITFAKEIRERDEQPHPEDSTSQEAAALASLQEQYAALQLSFQASTKKLEEEITRLTSEVTTQQPGRVLLPQPATSIATQPPKVTIRREFKNNGQIGERGQKDKLSYSNLIHQIDMGLRKNHSEAEIIEAVVRAISPGLTLRDMLEIKSDLTLSQLRTILKGHYKEDSSTDLYHRLINITQDSNESPQNFLFRAIGLKERLLVDSRELSADEQYSPELVQKKFLRAVRTGLINDNVKYQLKTYLDDITVADDVLIAKTNEADSLEWERQQKFRKNNKKLRVREIRAEAQSTPEATVGAVGGQERASSTPTKGKTVKTQSPVSPSDIELLDIIKQLKREVEEIKKAIYESPRSSGQQRTSRRRACRTCQDNNKGEQCDHCFKCGQNGHLSRGCRTGRRGADKPGQVDMSANTVTATPTPPTEKENQNEQFRDMYKLVTDSIRYKRDKSGS